MKTLMRKLLEAAEQLVSENTNTSLVMITPAMCERAQKMLDQMKQAMVDNDVMRFNQALVKLYNAIPRSTNGKNFLEFDTEGQENRIKWEQEFLDAINGALKGLTVVKDKNADKINQIMSEFKLSGHPATETELEEIRSMMGKDSSKLIRAYRVENETTRRNYENYIKEKNISRCKLLWHGSSTGNFLSILTNGLSLSKANSFGMFGQGIYFAKDFDKSRGYCSARNCRWRGGRDESAMLALFDVATGTPLHLNDSCNKLHRGSKELVGKDSVHAHSGHSLVRDEFIVYDNNAATIKYIIETR